MVRITGLYALPEQPLDSSIVRSANGGVSATVQFDNGPSLSSAMRGLDVISNALGDIAGGLTFDRLRKVEESTDAG